MDIKLIRTRFAPSLSGELHIGNLASLVYNCILCNNEDKDSSLTWRVDGIISKINFSILRRQLSILGWIKRILPRNFQIIFLRDKMSFYGNEIIFLIRRGYLKFVSEGQYRDCYVLRSHVSSDRKEHVVIRSNGRLTYILSSVLMDYRYGINTLIRGNDLLNTWILQKQILDWLNYELNTVIHHGLFLCKSRKITKKTSREMYIEHWLGKGYSIFSLVRWIIQHSKRKHDLPLTGDNLATTNKVVNYDQLDLWLAKNQKYNTWKDVKHFYPNRYSYFLFWTLWRRNLRNNLDLYGLIRNYRTEEFLLTVKERSEMRSLVRKLLWGVRSAPDFKNTFLLLGKKDIMNRIMRILID